MKLHCRVAIAVRLLSYAILFGILAFGVLSISGLNVQPAQAASALSNAKQDLEQAKKDLAAIQVQLDKWAQKKNDAEVKLAKTEKTIANTQSDLRRAEVDLEIAREQLSSRMVEIYKSRDSQGVQALEGILSADDVSIGAVIERVSMLNRIAEHDNELAERVKDNIGEIEELTVSLDQQKAEQEKDKAAFIKAHNEALSDFDNQKTRYNALRAKVKRLEEEERRRQEELARQKAEAEARAKAGGNTTGGNTGGTKTKTTTGGGGGGGGNTGGGGGKVVGGGGSWVFPVQGPNSFINSWGAARSGGRSHEGTDIMTARNTPVVACVSGSISSTSPTNSGLGGITIFLRGNDGNSYYYAHLNSIQGGIKSGVGVKAGQIIGYAGNTGNASGGAVHLHFEIRTPSGKINPYHTLVKYR